MPLVEERLIDDKTMIIMIESDPWIDRIALYIYSNECLTANTQTQAKKLKYIETGI